jgi:dihydropteroate synthase
LLPAFFISAMPDIHCGSFRLSLDRPLIMGIVNLTPDSFSGDGTGTDVERAIRHARHQLEAGADILDLGAESSRPGAIQTPDDEELRRLLPVLREIVGWGVPVSVDTYKPAVMRAALEAGAAMINDISALRHPGALAAVAASDCAVCLMHMQGEPRTMQLAPRYHDVLAEVRGFLRERVARCVEAGIARSRLVVDPGFGFGKTLAHNLELLRRLREIAADGIPVLAGMSRKSLIAALTGRDDADRLGGSVALATIAAQNGARIVRAHDVGPTVDALRIAMAIGAEQGRPG